MGHEMTPVGVFFSAQIPTADFLRPLCQQLHFEDYRKMCYDRDHGRFLTPDGLRVICEGLNRNPEAIGKHILETLAQMQSKG